MSDLIITIGPKAIMTPVSFVNRVVKDKQTCFYLASFNTNTIPWCICFLPRCICFPLFWSPESPRWRSSTRATSFPRVFVAVHWKRTVSAWHVQANKYKYEASSIKQIQIQRMFYYTFYRLLQLLPWACYHRSQTESFGKKCHLRTDEQ